MQKRQFIQLVGAALAAFAVSTPALAQWKPTRPINLIVPWAAGGSTDQVTRVAAAEINWVRPQQMHLTLKFLGDVPDTETPDICRVVDQVAAVFEPFGQLFDITTAE